MKNGKKSKKRNRIRKRRVRHRRKGKIWKRGKSRE
jgi:hypothetical protein